MRRSFLKQALVVLATCALFLPIAVDYGVPAQAATFTFTDSNCTSFTFDGSTLTCQTSGGGGGGALSCNPVGASPSSSTSVGNNVTLTANCSGGTAPYTYAWTGGGGNCPTSGGTNSTQLLTSPAAAVNGCAYSVQVNDSASPSAQVSKGVNVSWNAGGGGGGGGPLNCSGAVNSANGSTTITGPTLTIDIAWPPDNAQYQYITANTGVFQPDGAIVLRFTTSGAASSTDTKGIIKGVEYQSATAGRTGTLSTQPCDFLGANDLPKSGTGCSPSKFSNQPAPSEGFSQGTTKPGTCGYALQPNTTYYMNISNTNNNCNGSSCGMIFYFQKAGGT